MLNIHNQLKTDKKIIVPTMIQTPDNYSKYLALNDQQITVHDIMRKHGIQIAPEVIEFCSVADTAYGLLQPIDPVNKIKSIDYLLNPENLTNRTAKYIKAYGETRHQNIVNNLEILRNQFNQLDGKEFKLISGLPLIPNIRAARDMKFILFDLLDGYIIKKMFEYPKNRGGIQPNGKDRGLDHARVKDIADNFNIDAFGTLTFVIMPEVGLMLGDGHTRFNGALSRLYKNNMTSDELISPVSARIVTLDYFLSVYCGLNNTDGHTPTDQVTNTDLVGGNLMDSVIKYLHPSHKKYILSTQLRTLVNILYHYDLYKKGEFRNLDGRDARWSYGQVYALKEVSKEILNKPKEEVTLSRDSYIDVIDAVNRYLEYANLTKDYTQREYDTSSIKSEKVKRDMDRTKREVRNILRSAGWIGVHVVDSLSNAEDKLFPDQKTMIKRTVMHSTWLAEQMNMLSTKSGKNNLAVERIAAQMHTENAIF